MATCALFLNLFFFYVDYFSVLGNLIPNISPVSSLFAWMAPCLVVRLVLGHVQNMLIDIFLQKKYSSQNFTDRQILWHHVRRFVDFFFQLNLLPLYSLHSQEDKLSSTIPSVLNLAELLDVLQRTQDIQSCDWETDLDLELKSRPRNEISFFKFKQIQIIW